ncbi:Unknown protein, partial [Striga hermonthica]
DDPIDDRILDLLIQIRWSLDGHLNGIPIRFDDRNIWREMARILNEEPDITIEDYQVYDRAKSLRTRFRCR